VVLGVADAWSPARRPAPAPGTAAAATAAGLRATERAAGTVMEGIASVVAVLVWPALLGFVLWLFKTPLIALLDARTARLRGGPT
jgi:hypothetical protein